ncbi:MAG: hypothetical protein Q9219_007178 [cf. Caloplaca sp. 3 TL-2023]
MTSELSKRLLIAVRHRIVRLLSKISNALAGSIPVPGASEIWHDPEQMPYNPATVLDTMRIPLANVLAKSARHVSLGTLSDEIRSEIVADAKAVHATYQSWPSLVPKDWWPIELERGLIPEGIINAGVHGDYCDLYSHTSVCETWLAWRTSRVRILSLIADHDQAESRHNIILQMQETADKILASVPFMLGSKSKPADMYNRDFLYPCLPGETVSTGHYQSAAAFGGLVLWIPLQTLLENMRHLRRDQIQFSLKQVRRLAILYDVRMPAQEGTLTE